MVLSDEQLDVLIDTVESRLAQMLVFGCEDREELASLKRCRLELRVTRAAHPREGAGRLRFHPLRRMDEGAPLGTDPLGAREGAGPGRTPPGEVRGPVSRPKKKTADPRSGLNGTRPRAQTPRRRRYTPEAHTV